MDPAPTFPLPQMPPVDLGEIIRRTNEAAHGMMPYVEGFYQDLEKRTAAAEGELKKAAAPLTKLLRVRTSMATKRLGTAVQPVADLLAERTAAAQRGMLDFPIPVGPAAPQAPTLEWYWWERG